ncbi:MAG: helix-turn-helix transcriptional regulator [Lachnospira sp.]|nr:helix-turn-helix transcriptional regulator [Lachnospira sp.]
MKCFDMNQDFRIYKIRRDGTQGRQDSHSHPYYEIFYLINGDCTFFVDHNVYKLNKGDLVIVPKGDIHKSSYPEHGFSERFVLSFKDNNLDWLNELIGEQTVKESLVQGVISIPDKRRDYVEALMNKMIFESGGQDALSPAFIKASFVELMLFIIRCQRFEQNVIKEVDVDNMLIQEIATYIYNNYDKRISLDDISTKFHISRSYLSKKFKAVTGFGFKEYLINIRIKKACSLLLETDRSITDIAFECGFNDSNYFGDAFRNVKGVSPHKYRKNNEAI